MLFPQGFSNVRGMVKLLFTLLLIKGMQPVSSVELTYSCDDVVGRMPDHVNLTLTTSSNDQRTFTLTHVDQFDLDTELFTMTTNQDGSLRYQKEALVYDQNTAFYQDGAKAGVFKVVRTDRTTSARPHLQFEGQFSLGKFTYTLDAKTRVRRDVTSSVRSSEIVYRLRKQARRKLHLFFDDVESSNISEEVKTTVMGSSTPVRQKRQAPATYYIDIAAVVDYKSYSIFLNRYGDRATALRETLEYYSYVIAGVDLLYQRIASTDYRIRVRLIKVIVAEVASASNFTTSHVLSNDLLDAGALVDAFRAFLAGSGRVLVGPYDHVMLFTGYDLRVKVPSYYYLYYYYRDIVGRATIGTMCQQDGSSSSFVEDQGDFQSIEIAAHELAHSLSAQHDGNSNTCSSYSNYIMAPATSSADDRENSNRWRFSRCTLQYFGNLFQKLLQTRDGASCLTGLIPKSSNIPDENYGLPGLKYSAQAQCRMWHGNESTVCYGKTDDLRSFTSSSLCRTIWCRSKWGSSVCDSKIPLPGTPCDDGKLCLHGECVQHPKAPQKICLFGDVPTLSCSQEVRSNPSLCSSTLFNRYCCESCSAHPKELEVAQTVESATAQTNREKWLIVIANIEGACIFILVLAQIGCCLKFKAMKGKYKSVSLSEKLDSA
ncbi:unnamed protein product [Lymnaea stagnalis]|uniref:Peptidase M12B domain-containing protein n=1 Tax=Lymnaea stagnalis TaxID=6523 RepID=A0AAV2IKV0_LYMST